MTRLMWLGVVAICWPSTVVAAQPRCVKECREYGGCTDAGTLCIPTNFEHCRRSNQCKSEGKCHLWTEAPSTQYPGGQSSCVVGADADCRGSRLCREKGYCHAIKFWMDVKECYVRVRSPNDCRRRRGSKRFSPCLDDGYCTPQKGWSLGSTDALKCQPASDADCRSSERCRVSGMCAFKKRGPVPLCVSTPEDCRRSLACREQGKCASVWMFCEAASESACRRSVWCAKRGRCRLSKGECVR